MSYPSALQSEGLTGLLLFRVQGFRDLGFRGLGIQGNM